MDAFYKRLEEQEYSDAGNPPFPQYSWPNTVENA